MKRINLKWKSGFSNASEFQMCNENELKNNLHFWDKLTQIISCFGLLATGIEYFVFYTIATDYRKKSH